MPKNGMRPIHPGEILREEFAAPLGLSANALSRELKVPTNRVTGILNGERAVTADTAFRLARYFGTTEEFWMNLQSAYELALVRPIAKAIAEQVKPRAKETA